MCCGTFCWSTAPWTPLFSEEILSAFLFYIQAKVLFQRTYLILYIVAQPVLVKTDSWVALKVVLTI